MCDGEYGHYDGIGPHRSVTMARIRGALLPAVAVTAAALLLGDAGFVFAGDPASAPPGQSGTIATGSPDVFVGDHPVAGQGDLTTNGAPVVTGSPNVFINGKPAVTSGDATNCSGVVIGSSASVFVNGKPLAGQGDATTGCRGK